MLVAVEVDAHQNPQTLLMPHMKVLNLIPRQLEQGYPEGPGSLPWTWRTLTEGQVLRVLCRWKHQQEHSLQIS